jgi:hypothetical protein
MKRTVSRWIDGYVRAWNSNDPEVIGALFNPRAVYRTGPFDAPWRGRRTIVDRWLARKDTPGTWKFRFDIVASRGDTAVVRGWTRYLSPPREFSNLWVIRFDREGRCLEFTEWWVQRA